MDALNMAKPRTGFIAPFKWDKNTICMIKHKHGGFLRANPKNHEECNYKGGQTDWSKWQIHLHQNANMIQIQNLKTKKYLEIDKHGKYISVSNEGGKLSKFKRHFTKSQSQSQSEESSDNDVIMNGNYDNDEKKENDENNKNDANMSTLSSKEEDGVKLESIYSSGLFLSVHPNDGVYISKNAENAHNLFYFLVQGKNDEVVLFKKAYSLKQQNTIIISHAFGGSIRMNPSEDSVDSEGDKDILSRWEALPNEDGSVLQFKNVKSGTFLCIKENEKVSCSEAKNDANTKFKVHVVQSPNIVKLESMSFEGKFISVRQKGLCVGNGGPHCQMTLYQKD